MVTSNHEASHRIFQERPELLAPVFRILGVPLPAEASVEVLSADVTEIRPLERRVDSVLRIEPRGGDDGFLLAIEAQGRCDRAKSVSWAYYLSFLKAKYSCPALLLVVCQDKATADWAAGPFRLGLDGWTALTVHPLVLGPGNVPMIVEPEEAAQDLALATFSAMTHGRHQDAKAILEALAQALDTADKDSVEYYSQLLEIGLGDTRARKIWREQMTIHNFFPGRGTLFEEKLLEGQAESRAEGLAEGRAEGEAKGRAQMVLRVLDGRGVLASPEIRERVMECTDLDTLGRWFDLALTVSEAEGIFGAEG
ncbi:hypothetical protein [Streptomyces sp. UNOC14_S4]|uniref:hypothetical protein n=1 Tax=Streptomyces sp. UNOC14_S4 TaxID=2872340 RepID=UPI001E5ADA2C|nr:hypothetical protein [Streptomyces sp. UNOC14_S4]MCC3770230.1 hypothetical protein [Streptomyces sp. UNOC14_S4]